MHINVHHSILYKKILINLFIFNTLLIQFTNWEHEKCRLRSAKSCFWFSLLEHLVKELQFKTPKKKILKFSNLVIFLISSLTSSVIFLISSLTSTFKYIKSHEDNV